MENRGLLRFSLLLDLEAVETSIVYGIAYVRD